MALKITIIVFNISKVYIKTSYINKKVYYSTKLRRDLDPTVIIDFTTI